MNRTERIVFSILLVWILLPNLMGVFIAKDLLTVGQHILYLIAAILLSFSGLCYLKRQTFFYVASLSFIPAAVEVTHQVVNHATTSLLFVFTCIKSEKGEFLELCSTYWFILIILFALWGVYFYLVHRFIRNEYALPHKWRMISLGVIALFFCIAIVGLKMGSKFRNMFGLQNQDLRTTAWVGVEKVCPINIFLSGYQLVDMLLDIHRMEKEVENFRFGVKPCQGNDSTIVVLLLGETSRYDHWQINGYPRATSPCLMARQQELVRFDSCFSIANLTTVSVPMILSRATPENVRLYMEEKSVVEAFHEAGYRTSWIADQSFNNEFLLRISGACDYQQYMMDDGDLPNFVDTVLLTPLRTTLAQSATRQMIVLHSLGCHFKYSARYPDTERYFQPDMEDGLMPSLTKDLEVEANPEEISLRNSDSYLVDQLKINLVNSYDNAIHYSDYFIDQVIRILESTDRPVVLVYVADHGENLLDDERRMFLHGTFCGSVYEYHVPLFVWTSLSYRQQHPEKLLAMQSNQKKIFSTMALFHSLLDLGNIHYEKLDSTNCFTQPTLQSRTVIYGLDANMHTFEIPLH